MKIVGLTAFAIFFVSGAYALFGGKSGVSSTELNSLSHACLAGWTLIAGILLVVFYRHQSNAVTGTFALVESRKRNRGKWILKGFATVSICAGVVWLTGYGALACASTQLSRPASQQDAVIASARRFNGSRSCSEIEVRLQDGGNHWICARRWAFGEYAPANARCARVGDRAVVAEGSSALGKTLTLLSMNTSGC